MKRNSALYSFASVHHATPPAVRAALDAEFALDFDPCPLDSSVTVGTPLFGTDGLFVSWAGRRVFCNPPYGRGIVAWLAKGAEAECAVYLLPARTDTAWWHEWAPKASEIRFLKGRLKFGGAKCGAPFPSVVLVFDNASDAGKVSAQSNEVGK